MKRAQLPTQRINVSFLTATIFDIPMIFDLMYEGSVAGSFGAVFVERTGSVKLLVMIFKSLVAQSFQSPRSGKRYEWQVVVDSNEDKVGFLKHSVILGNVQSQHLELFAILPEYRNKGVGTAVLQDIISNLLQGTQIMVYCTKYAMTMQHILKRQRFKRSVRFSSPHLEEYVLRKDKI